MVVIIICIRWMDVHGCHNRMYLNAEMMVIPITVKCQSDVRVKHRARDPGVSFLFLRSVQVPDLLYVLGGKATNLTGKSKRDYISNFVSALFVIWSGDRGFLRSLIRLVRS